MDTSPDLVPPLGSVAVIAVSGGLDSTVLARTWAPLLRRWGCHPLLAHVDHGLRGEQSDADRDFVVALAEELALPIRLASLPPDPDAVSEVGLEATLRSARRGFLRTVAAQHGATRVYLGHHRDDQVETIVLRLLEGVPAARVTGMRRVHGLWARPLLAVPRSQLRSVAEEHGWSWREDASNTDERHPRNRVRVSVLPALRAADPRFDDALLAAAAAALARRDELDAAVRSLAGEVVRRSVDGAARVDSAGLTSADPVVALALLQRLCDPGDLPRRPPNRSSLSALLELPSGRSRRFDLGGGWTGRVEAGELRLLRDAALPLEAAAPPATPWTEPTVTWSGGWVLRQQLVPTSEAFELLEQPGAGRSFALFDADRVAAPLCLMAAPASVRMRPYGLEGSATVRRILSEAGVPRSARGDHPAVVDARGEVLWLPGVRAAADGALDRGSRQALLLYTEQSPEANRETPQTGRHAETP